MRSDNYRRLYFKLVLVFLVLRFCLPLPAQDPKGSRVLTLKEAIDFALRNYPSVRASLERVAAARAGVSLARVNYLPRTDLQWQSNRATHNNIFGLLFPTTVIPPISGPVLPATSDAAAWGSAAGILFSWEPFDFGYRGATVRAAKSVEERAGAEAALTRLDIASAAAGSFMSLVAARERVRAAQADVERREVFSKSVHALVASELRPGADASRAAAELAAARIQLIQARQAEQVARATLAQLLGIAGSDVQINASGLLEAPPVSVLAPVPIGAHPFAEVEKARVNEEKARVRGLERQYYPRFYFQSAVSGRGSGSNLNGTVAGGTNGLGLERGNWAAGLTVAFPLFEIASIHARKRIELSNERAEAARYDQAVQDLTGQLEKARAVLEGARQIAENTPVQLQAARDTETQTRARYQAGLATIVEVADAQRLLVQAEIDDAVARMNIWGALFGVAAAQGDLQPFLNL